MNHLLHVPGELPEEANVRRLQAQVDEHLASKEIERRRKLAVTRAETLRSQLTAMGLNPVA